MFNQDVWERAGEVVFDQMRNSHAAVLQAALAANVELARVKPDLLANRCTVPSEIVPPRL